MTIVKEVKSSGIFIGKFDYGSDLLEAMNEICKKKNIRLGRIEALGAVQKARLGFYDQQTKEYQFLNLDQPFEITKLIGNISLKDGHPFVHAHVTLAGQNGNACGGHLASGTLVFACEFILEAFDGPALERNFDNVTGLSLWTMTE